MVQGARDSVQGSAASTLHAALRCAAESLLREVFSAPPTHAKALTLLAADALMTFAVEAEFELAEG